jgi:glycosyltransferase involved in cell wall biosynthesis
LKTAEKTHSRPLRIVAWGTYDTGKPRVRILLRGLRENGVEVIECHKQVWTGIEDKSQIKGFASKLKFLLRWLGSYPGLVWRFLRLPRHDAVLLSYMGHLDVLVLWPFAKLRRVPLAWDAFLSLYDTVVCDRKLVSRHHPLSWLLYAWEWLACRAADVVILDTAAHGRYFIDTFGVQASKVRSVFVGVEPDRFHPLDKPSTLSRKNERFVVLFYGQFIPLHGIETVVRAAKLGENDGISWHLIGSGQEAEKIRALVDDLSPSNLRWETWVPYEKLLDRIEDANVCLGIFGATEKAARVIPNKVFQIIAAGKPLISADTPAVRELLEPGPAIQLVPTADPNALRQAVLRMRDAGFPPHHCIDPTLRRQIEPSAVVRPLRDLLAQLSRQPIDSAAA